jgi:hypothetical protein
MTAGPSKNRDSFLEAAAKARAPLFVFKLWLLEHAANVSPSLWGQWKSGKRPVPTDYVLDFVQDDDWVPDQETLAYLEGRLAAKRAKEALPARARSDERSGGTPTPPGPRGPAAAARHPRVDRGRTVS